ncbi:MAG: TetR/AcrR family transcriptional regulator [Euzebyales bacterium]|nr:TetR/AcrR family transcriptional regulator [Euzebyales bacterium]
MVKAPRRYDATGRQRQALTTRRRVLQTAGQLFVECGYAATTIATIAERAGVSQQLVYVAFESKRRLLKAVVDTTIAGDDAPVPLLRRPRILAMRRETDPHRKLAMFGAYLREANARVGPVMRMLRGAADADPDARELHATLEGQRRTGMGVMAGDLAAVGGLQEHLDVQAAADIAWTLASPVLYVMLVEDRGWSGERYERWVTEQLSAALLRSD